MKIFTYLPGITDAEMDGYEQVDLSEIGEVDNASCNEVFVGECLDFIEQREDFGNELVKKIAYEGPITIIGLDIFEICRAIDTCQVDLPAINTILYRHRCSVSDITNMVKWVHRCGLKIVSQRVEDFRYTIIAKTPSPEDGSTNN